MDALETMFADPDLWLQALKTDNDELRHWEQQAAVHEGRITEVEEQLKELL